MFPLKLKLSVRAEAGIRRLEGLNETGVRTRCSVFCCRHALQRGSTRQSRHLITLLHQS